MQVNKFSKLKRQEKFFTISLGICCAILCMMVMLSLIITSGIKILDNISLNLLILLLFSIVYILPVIGLVSLFLGLLYIVKMLRYNGKKGKMILKSTGIFLFTLILLFLTFYTFLQTLFHNSVIILYTYRTLATLDIVFIILLYVVCYNQFKFLIKDSINKLDNLQEKNKIIKEDSATCSFRSSNTKNFLIFGCTLVIIVVIGIFVIIVQYKDTENQSKHLMENKVSHNNIEEISENESNTYYINAQIGYKIHLGSLWRDRYQVEIYKTEDRGQNWQKIDSNLTEVYIRSEFMFLDENIGFVHDPYGGVDSYDILKITRDGAKTWEEVKLNKADNIKENNIFIKNLPIVNGENLEVIAYTVDSTRSPKYKYYKFESRDRGITWNYVEEIEDYK